MEIDTISDLIKDVEFKADNFSKSIKYVKAGDFVYLDPPYAPESNKSFVGYVADGFTIEMHKELFTQIKRLNEVNELDKKHKTEKIRFVMSNSNVELVRDTFKYYELSVVQARRAINSKNPESITTEVIIHN